jgi:hypothetical protein
VQIYVSADALAGWSSSMVGLRSPILVLKSPQMIVFSCGCSSSSVLAMCSVASDSGMFRLFSDAVGGR